jgi:hypothetical protein
VHVRRRWRERGVDLGRRRSGGLYRVGSRDGRDCGLRGRAGRRSEGS